MTENRDATHIKNSHNENEVINILSILKLIY